MAIDITFEKGLPQNTDAERFVLGSIMLNDAFYSQVADALERNDFSLEKHRRIFASMKSLNDRGGRIDRVTVADELMRFGHLESVDGLTYLVSLDQGLPELINLDSYIRIVKDKATLRKLIFSAQSMINRCLVGEEDPRQILESLSEQVRQIQDAASWDDKQGALTPGAIIERYPGGVNSFMDPTQRVKGFDTGFYKLDDLTGGFLGGQLIVLAGLQASGKTALALNIAANFIFRAAPIPTAVLTYEMPPASLLTRMISSRSRVSNYRIKHGYVSQDERRRMQVAAAELASVPLFISGESRDIRFITRQIKNMATRGCEWEDANGRKAVSRIRFVVIDRLEKITAESFNKNRSEADRIGHVTGELQALALSLNIVIMLLCQISRRDKTQSGKRHTCADLKGSSSIEQDADIVLFTFRPWLWSRDREDLKDQAEILLEKQKDGDIGVIPVVFKGEYTLFLNPEQEGAQP